MTKSSTIYEKQFPKWEMPTEEEMKEIDVAGEETEHLTFEQILEKIYKDVVYVLMPERREEAKVFIRKAISVSELYEMDIKIEHHFSHISATYYFDYSGGMKYLTDVIGMADDIAFFGRKDHKYDIVMSLDFYTHAEYRRGRRVQP